MRLLPLLLLSVFSAAAEPVFREDFKEVPAHIPVTADDLTSDFLTLERLGPGADQLKLSHHPEVKNDPHYVWNGECKGPVLIAFPFKKTLDLSGARWNVRLHTKNFGPSTLHLAVRSGKEWLVQETPVANAKDWNEQTIPLHGGTWRTLDPDTVKVGAKVTKLDFSRIDALGFAAPRRANRSKDCIRLDWFELLQAEPEPKLPAGGFLENETPFLRTALVLDIEGADNLVRRGVLLPLGHGHWGCFDTDLLRWAAIWKAPPGEAPITYDSMAAVSYPDEKAKAVRPPTLRGKIVFSSPELPGAAPGTQLGKDPRSARITNTDKPLGPLPLSHGRWMGISLRGASTVLHYRVGDAEVSEIIAADHTGGFARFLEIGPSSKPVTFRLGKPAYQAPKLTLPGATSPRLKRLMTSGYQGAALPFPDPHSAPPLGNEAARSKALPPSTDGPLAVRNLPLPTTARAIRPADLAFLSDGTALLATFDGDIWRIEDIEGETAAWRRVATGLFEPMGIEVWRDKVFVLGRDQITELIDTNQDGIIDIFRNASDAFLQTLHTRDFAMSLDIADDGSFLVSKGGIYSMGKGAHPENSTHRGAVLRISPDGNSVAVLADGLRMPYAGLRSDGAVFASDQQGNFVPSTPIHRIGGGRPYLGFKPTNHRNLEKLTEPLLYYPHQTNRSGAGFVQLSGKAFPDLADAFLQISWNGRLFAIATPEKGRPFSWQLPLQLDFASLNGAVHPLSGRLYLTGLGISAYKPTTPHLLGLASVEQVAPLPTPASLHVSADRIAVTFNRPLTADETVIPGTPALRLFDVKRTAKYGSGHFRWDGEPGEHRLQPKAFSLSPDRRTLTLKFDALRRSEILDLHLAVSVGASTVPIHLYSRPAQLPEATKREIAALDKAEGATPELRPGDATRGKGMFTQYACAGCHSLTGESLAGPPLLGVASRHDEAYLRESILAPANKITEGYEPAMPSFDGVIPPQDLEDLIAYLKNLR